MPVKQALRPILSKWGIERARRTTSVKFTLGDTVLFEMELKGPAAERLTKMDTEKLKEAGQKMLEALIAIVSA